MSARALLLFPLLAVAAAAQTVTPLPEIETTAGLGSEPTGFVAAGGRTYFTAANAATGRELWSSDGTTVRRETDLDPGSANGVTATEAPPVFGTTLLVNGEGSPSGIFRFDTTDGGVAFATPSYGGANWQLMNGRVFFMGLANSTSDPYGLWRTDGTTFELVRALPSTAKDVVQLDGHLIFTVAQVLWSSAGRDAGSTTTLGAADGLGVTVIGHHAWFTANDSEVWRTDGTDSDHHRMGQLPSGDVFAQISVAGDVVLVPATSGLWGLPVTGGAMVHLASGFRASPFSLGRFAIFEDSSAAWVTDGTVAGTRRLADVTPYGPAVRAGNTLYFTGHETTSGTELWRTDGTPQGTRLVQDLASGPGDSDPRDFVVLGDSVWLSAVTPDAGREPWKMTVDVTPPRVVASPADAGGWFRGDVAVSFAVSDPDSALEVRPDLSCDGGTVTADTAGAPYSCSAASQGGITRVDVLIRRDGTPPVITDCPQSVERATLTSTLAVDYGAVTAIDALSAVTVSYDHDRAVPFTFPGADVTATARDEAGNTATCTFHVGLVDADRPALQCPQAVVLEPTDKEGLELDALPAGAVTASDAIDPVTPAIEWSFSPGTRFAVDSTTTVTATAVDRAGNRSAPCSLELTVTCKSDACRDQVKAQPMRSHLSCGCSGPGAGLGLAAVLLRALRRKRNA